MFAEVTFWDRSLAIRNTDQARGWASKHLPLPPVFFSRTPEGGFIYQPNGLTVHPSASWNGFRGVTIDSFGEAATRTLMAHLAQSQSAFEREYPGGEVRHRFGVAGVRIATRPQHYRLMDLVLTNSASRRNIASQWKERPDIKAVTEIAEKVFMTQMEVRLGLLPLDLPEEAVFGDFEAEVVRPVLAGGAYKFAVNLAFRTNLVFDGPWNIGKLANKGSGRVRRAAYPAVMASRLPEPETEMV